MTGTTGQENAPYPIGYALLTYVVPPGPFVVKARPDLPHHSKEGTA